MGEVAIGTLAATIDIGNAVETVRRDVPVIVKSCCCAWFHQKSWIGCRSRRTVASTPQWPGLRRVIDEVITSTRKGGGTDQPDLLAMPLDARDTDTGESLSGTDPRRTRHRPLRWH